MSMRRKVNFDEVSVATWRNPALSVVHRKAFDAPMISPEAAARPYIPGYKYIPFLPPPEPTDEEASDDDDDDTSAEEMEASHMAPMREQNDAAVAAEDDDHAAVLETDIQANHGGMEVEDEQKMDQLIDSPSALDVGMPDLEIREGITCDDELVEQQGEHRNESLEDDTGSSAIPKDHIEEKQVSFDPGTPEPRPTHRKKKTSKGGKVSRKRRSVPINNIDPVFVAMADQMQPIEPVSFNGGDQSSLGMSRDAKVLNAYDDGNLATGVDSIMGGAESALPGEEDALETLEEEEAIQSASPDLLPITTTEEDNSIDRALTIAELENSTRTTEALPVPGLQIEANVVAPMAISSIEEPISSTAEVDAPPVDAMTVDSSKFASSSKKRSSKARKNSSSKSASKKKSSKTRKVVEEDPVPPANLSLDILQHTIEEAPEKTPPNSEPAGDAVADAAEVAINVEPSAPSETTQTENGNDLQPVQPEESNPDALPTQKDDDPMGENVATTGIEQGEGAADGIRDVDEPAAQSTDDAVDVANEVRDLETAVEVGLMSEPHHGAINEEDGKGSFTPIDSGIDLEDRVAPPSKNSIPFETGEPDAHSDTTSYAATEDADLSSLEDDVSELAGALSGPNDLIVDDLTDALSIDKESVDNDIDRQAKGGRQFTLDDLQPEATKGDLEDVILEPAVKHINEEPVVETAADTEEATFSIGEPGPDENLTTDPAQIITEEQGDRSCEQELLREELEPIREEPVDDEYQALWESSMAHELDHKEHHDEHHEVVEEHDHHGGESIVDHGHKSVVHEIHSHTSKYSDGGSSDVDPMDEKLVGGVIEADKAASSGVEEELVAEDSAFVHAAEPSVHIAEASVHEAEIEMIGEELTTPPSPDVSIYGSHQSYRHRADHWERPRAERARNRIFEDSRVLQRPHSSRDRDHISRKRVAVRENPHKSVRRSTSTREEDEERRARRTARRAIEDAARFADEQQRIEEVERRRLRHEAIRIEMAERARMARELDERYAPRSLERRSREYEPVRVSSRPHREVKATLPTLALPILSKGFRENDFVHGTSSIRGLDQGDRRAVSRDSHGYPPLTRGSDSGTNPRPSSSGHSSSHRKHRHHHSHRSDERERRGSGEKSRERRNERASREEEWPRSFLGGLLRGF